MYYIALVCEPVGYETFRGIFWNVEMSGILRCQDPISEKKKLINSLEFW